MYSKNTTEEGHMTSWYKMKWISTWVRRRFLWDLQKSLIKQAINSSLFEGIAFKSLLYYYERREINTEKYNLQYSNNKEELL